MTLSQPLIFCLFSIALTFSPIQQAIAQQISDSFAPESTNFRANRTPNKPAKSKNWMVSVANPYAANTAARILSQGGNAIDAAIAAQLVLGLVEPQSSGLGGGAFLVYFDAKTKTLTTLDGRETAPQAATEMLFQDSNGEPIKFFDAVIGGRSVGVPGTPALLAKMAQNWGSKPWESLFQPAIALSDNGFIVSPRLEGQLKRARTSLSRQPAASTYFYPKGKPLLAGTRLKNPLLAQTLRTLAIQGTKPLYAGPMADEIVKTITGFAANPGVMSKTDLASYKVKQRKPVCAPYRQYNVCGMGPPSSGALTIGQILGLLAPHTLNTKSSTSVEAWRLIADATRLAFADRGRYMADMDYVKMPLKGLLKPSYLQSRSRLLVGPGKLQNAIAGEPEWEDASLQRADDEAIELPSTTHFSIVDNQGNVVSMTSTIENGFGSRLMVGGFLLNNELTDFSFRSHKNGKPIANRLQPRKRPRSSMAPTIVMKDGKPVLAIGSPGGSRIIPYVAKTLIAYLDWGMNIQQAISSPHLINRFGTYDLEAGTTAEAFEPALSAMGYKTKITNLNSGLHAIAITPNGLEGGADPRREGIVLGK